MSSTGVIEEVCSKLRVPREPYDDYRQFKLQTVDGNDIPGSMSLSAFGLGTNFNNNSQMTVRLVHRQFGIVSCSHSRFQK